MYYFFVLFIAAIIAFIPANIAKEKGHSFTTWWFYGWMLWIVAIIHVQFIEDRNEKPEDFRLPTYSKPYDDDKK